MTSPTALLYNTHYHIYNRGNNRENIFLQERNYEYFLNLYQKYIPPIAETFAYCLLPNHFHLLVRIKAEDEITGTQKVVTSSKPLRITYPSQQFSHFFNAYAKAINKSLNRVGSLFQHPFGRVPITNVNRFWSVIAYIDQNPQKQKFVEDFREWNWSSYGIILSEKPTILSRQGILDWFGGRENYREMHAQWVINPTFAPDDEGEYPATKPYRSCGRPVGLI